jgi:hypothetical protein
MSELLHFGCKDRYFFPTLLARRQILKQV